MEPMEEAATTVQGYVLAQLTVDGQALDGQVQHTHGSLGHRLQMPFRDYREMRLQDTPAGQCWQGRQPLRP